jgi:hypothetical protein
LSAPAAASNGLIASACYSILDHADFRDLNLQYILYPRALTVLSSEMYMKAEVMI